MSSELNIRYSDSRRFFLGILAAFTFLLSCPASVWAFFIDKFPVRTVEKADFRFNPKKGLIEWQGGESELFILTIDGLVKEPVTLTYDDLKALPQVEQIADFHCVEGWSVKDTRWGGFRFGDIMKKVESASEARYAIFHSLGETESRPRGQDHYIESFPISELLDPEREILLVLDMNGKTLPHDHGAPLRLIAPYDLGYKNIKFINRIELSYEEKPGWWTLANPIYTIKARVPGERLRKK
ncbi:MAG: molybdopterin-dependent oxidoreductase [Deltaproteobacteria bacterium]|nr:molybdopterin-dependent oxidoreductase [Deltaproteobacteria bacterium]